MKRRFHWLIILACASAWACAAPSDPDDDGEGSNEEGGAGESGGTLGGAPASGGAEGGSSVGGQGGVDEGAAGSGAGGTGSMAGAAAGAGAGRGGADEGGSGGSGGSGGTNAGGGNGGTSGPGQGGAAGGTMTVEGNVAIIGMGPVSAGPFQIGFDEIPEATEIGSHAMLDAGNDAINVILANYARIRHARSGLVFHARYSDTMKPRQLRVYGKSFGYASNIIEPRSHNTHLIVEREDGGAFDIDSFEYMGNVYGGGGDFEVRGTFGNDSTMKVVKTFGTSKTKINTMQLGWKGLKRLVIDYGHPEATSKAFAAVDNFVGQIP